MKGLDPNGKVTINRFTHTHQAALRHVEKAIASLTNNEPYHGAGAYKALEYGTKAADLLWDCLDLVHWTELVENMSFFLDDHIEEDFLDGLIEFHQVLENSINNSIRRTVGL